MLLDWNATGIQAVYGNSIHSRLLARVVFRWGIELSKRLSSG